MPPAVNDRAKIGIAAERGVAVMLFALVVSPVFYFSLFFFVFHFHVYSGRVRTACARHPAQPEVRACLRPGVPLWLHFPWRSARPDRRPFGVAAAGRMDGPSPWLLLVAIGVVCACSGCQ